ncbi:MAG: DNA translocase FtsK [Planctomycetaceae bacterium]|nr:DNA translocase FtsK [Planctomycetaceae bacterium]
MASANQQIAGGVAQRLATGDYIIDPDIPHRAGIGRSRQLFAIVLIPIVIFVSVALLSFDPADPPASRGFPPRIVPVNLCGHLGASVSTLIYQSTGVAGWLGVAFLAGLAIGLFRNQRYADLPWRASGAVFSILSLAMLCTLFMPSFIPRPLWGPGGLAGTLVADVAIRHLASAGAALVGLTALGVGLFLTADRLVVRVLRFSISMVTHLGEQSIRFLQYPLLRINALRDSSTEETAESEWWQRRRTSTLNAEDSEKEDDGIAIKVRGRKPKIEDAVEEEYEEEEYEEEEEEVEEETVAPPSALVPIKNRQSRPTRQLELEISPDPEGNYELPSVELLLPPEEMELDEQEAEVRKRAKILEKTFANFGFRVRVVEVETGPVISQYEIELEAGLRLAKITNLADDLAIALRVPSVRIVAPIPGKNSVGVEVPNTDRQMVRLREVMEETNSKSRAMKIPIYLGKDVSGNPMVVDLATMPHLLIAGRTGTGKSVCLNSIIVSMLMTRRPDEVRMLMIDPKMVELTPYKSLPHLMHPVVTDMKKAEAILAWAVDKMEQRYTLLASAGVRHLSQYNSLGREEILKRIQPETDEDADAIPTTMPYIVMVADEIADMMMTAGKEIEQYIIRLAQKSRAVGIHLILATQKPTVDVITGLIKSNLPARIAFQVASRTDSRVVLDECGAERLLGNGDMLFLSPGTSLTLRGQGTFVSDDEIGRVMATIGTNEPQYAKELVNLQPAPTGDATTKGAPAKDRDELYEAAVEVVIREGRGSVSLLQRALGVGYGRGARMIDFMAEDGIVGQYAGSQAREVLMTMDEWAAAQGEEPLPPDPPPRRLKINPHAAEQIAVPIEDTDLTTDDDEAVEDLENDEVDDDEEEGSEEEQLADSAEEDESEDDLEDDEEYEYVYEDEEDDENAE